MFLDDLKTRVSQIGDLGKDIYGYIGIVKNDSAVKVGPAPTGNLSAAQIAAGQYGGQAGIPASQAAASSIQNANPSSVLPQQIMQYLPLIALVAIGAFVFKKSRKG